MYCFFADCNFSRLKVGTIPFTNWGITSNELEPKTADECVQMCVGGAECEPGTAGFGKWKTVACSSSLDYICEVPCKIFMP